MRRVERVLWVLLVGVVVGLAACVVGHKYQKPACQQVYDDCTDQCAPMCERNQTSALDPEDALYDTGDRKSTRLNSSH